MVTKPLIEKRKCYFCHKGGYADPNLPQNQTGWYLEFYGDEEYHICSKCFHGGKIRCSQCGGIAQKCWIGLSYDETSETYDDYEIKCPHCD